MDHESGAYGSENKGIKGGPGTWNKKFDFGGKDFGGNEQTYEMRNGIQTIKAGDIPGKGRYNCINCGTDITLTEGNRIPPCPRCGNLEFLKEKQYTQ